MVLPSGMSLSSLDSFPRRPLLNIESFKKPKQSWSCQPFSYWQENNSRVPPPIPSPAPPYAAMHAAPAQPQSTARNVNPRISEKGGERNRLHRFRIRQLHLVSRLWKYRLPLQIHFIAALPHLAFFNLVRPHTSNVSKAAFGRDNMLNADVDAFLQNFAVDLFVHTNPHGSRGHIIHDSCSAVVVLEWHALVLRWVALNVYIITSLSQRKRLHNIVR